MIDQLTVSNIRKQFWIASTFNRYHTIYIGMKLSIIFILSLTMKNIHRSSSLAIKRFLTTDSSSTYPSLSLRARVLANDISLDTYLLANNQDLVISHLQSRRSKPELLDDIAKIAVLRGRRRDKLIEGDAAKSIRKTLSQQIGQLMKAGKSEDVIVLKSKVEDASAVSASCDSELSDIDAEISRLFSVLPNLLADR